MVPENLVFSEALYVDILFRSAADNNMVFVRYKTPARVRGYFVRLDPAAGAPLAELPPCKILLHTYNHRSSGRFLKMIVSADEAKPGLLSKLSDDFWLWLEIYIARQIVQSASVEDRMLKDLGLTSWRAL